jgi:hypothetical protein
MAAAASAPANFSNGSTLDWIGAEAWLPFRFSRGYPWLRTHRQCAPATFSWELGS